MLKLTGSAIRARLSLLILITIMVFVGPRLVRVAAIQLSSPLNYLEVPTKPFVDAYGEQKAREIGYDGLTFSPDGKLLAITISQIASGDPEQVWIFDLGTRKLRLATEMVDKENIGLRILRVKWESSSTVAIEEDRIVWKDQSNNSHQIVHATMLTSTVEKRPWPENRDINLWATFESPSGRYRIEMITPHETRIVELPSGKEVLSADFWEKASWAFDDRHFVFVQGYGHGSFSLGGGLLTPDPTTFPIAKGSWELFGFATDPNHPRVAYMRNGAITLYDLDSRRVLQDIPIGPSPARQLGWSPQNRIAYAAEACPVQSSSLDGTASRTSMRRLCIIDVPPSRNQH